MMPRRRGRRRLLAAATAAAAAVFAAFFFAARPSSAHLLDLPPLPHEGLYSVEVAGRSDTGSVFAPPFLIYSDGK